MRARRRLLDAMPRALLLLLALLLPHTSTMLVNSSAQAPAAAPPPLALYGLFAASTAPPARAHALAAAAAGLAAALGLPLAPPADGSGAVEVPAPQTPSQLQHDDRVNVPSRALLVQGARRAYGDLGDARAVALALGHHAAWLRFQASGLPLALFVVEPESLQLGGGGGGAVVRQALDGAGAAWDLLVLASLVPPQRAAAAAAEAAAAAAHAAGGSAAEAAALAQAGWATPLRWRGWHAYALTQAGVGTLLREGALPLSQRLEAFASTLVDLGSLRALAPLPRGGSEGAEAGAAAAAAAALFARPEGWGLAGSASGGELAHMLVEAPCDLCAVPEDYSRMGHILLAAGPSAVVAGVLTTYLLQVTGCGKGLLS